MKDCAGKLKSKPNGFHKPENNPRLVAKLRADVQALAKTGVQKARECIDVLKFSEGLIRRDIDLIRLQLEIKLKKLESRLQAELRNSVDTETKRLDGFIEEVKALSDRDITEAATDQIDELKAKLARMEKKRLKFEANSNLEASLDQVTSFGRIVLQKVDEPEVQTGTGSGPKSSTVMNKGLKPMGTRRLSLDSGYCESQSSWREAKPGSIPIKQKHSPRASSVSNDRDLDAEIHDLENALGLSDDTCSVPYKIQGQNIPITLNANSYPNTDQHSLKHGDTASQINETLPNLEPNVDMKHCNDNKGYTKGSTTNDTTDAYPSGLINKKVGCIGPINSLTMSQRGLERVSAGPTENQLRYTVPTVKQPNNGAGVNKTVPSNDNVDETRTDYKPKRVPVEESIEDKVDGWSHADPFSILRALKQQTSQTEDNLKAVRHYPTPSANVVCGTLKFAHTKSDVKKGETDPRTDAREIAQKSTIRLANQTNNTEPTKSKPGSSATDKHVQPIVAGRPRTESAEVPNLTINGNRDARNDTPMYEDKVTRANELWFGRDKRRRRDCAAYKRRTRSLSPKTVRFQIEYLEEYSRDNDGDTVGEVNGNCQDIAMGASDHPGTMSSNNEIYLQVDDDGVMEEANTAKDYTGNDAGSQIKIGCNVLMTHKEEAEEDNKGQTEEVTQAEPEEDGEYFYCIASLIETQHQQEEEEQGNDEGVREDEEEIIQEGNNVHDKDKLHHQFVKAGGDKDTLTEEEVNDEHNEVLPERVISGTGLTPTKINLINTNVHKTQQVMPSSYRAPSPFNQNSCIQADNSSSGLNIFYKTNPFSIKSKYITDLNKSGSSHFINHYKDSTCEALVPDRNTVLQSNSSHEQDTRLQRLKDRRRRNRSIGGLIDNGLENVETNTLEDMDNVLGNARESIGRGVEHKIQTTWAHHSHKDDKIKSQIHHHIKDKRNHDEFKDVEYKESACETKGSGHKVTVQDPGSRNSNRLFDDRYEDIESDSVEHRGPSMESSALIRTVSNRQQLVENRGSLRECTKAIKDVSDIPQLVKGSGTPNKDVPSVKGLSEKPKLVERRVTSEECASVMRTVSDKPQLVDRNGTTKECSSSLRALIEGPNLDKRRGISDEDATAMGIVSDRPHLMKDRGTPKKCVSFLRTVSDGPKLDERRETSGKGSPFTTAVSPRLQLMKRSETSKGCSSSLRTVRDGPTIQERRGTPGRGIPSTGDVISRPQRMEHSETSKEGASSLRPASDGIRTYERRCVSRDSATAVKVISDRPRLVARRRRNKSIGGITENEHAKLDSESHFQNHKGSSSAHEYSNLDPAKSWINGGTCSADVNDINCTMRDVQRNAVYHPRRRLRSDCSANISTNVTPSGRISNVIVEDATTIKAQSKDHVVCNRSKPGKQRTDKQKLPSFSEMLFLE